MLLYLRKNDVLYLCINNCAFSDVLDTRNILGFLCLIFFFSNMSLFFDFIDLRFLTSSFAFKVLLRAEFFRF